MTVRISVHRYAGDQQQHGYRVDQEATGPHLVPVHSEWRYPDRHPRDMVSSEDLPSFGGAFDRCPGCSAWTRRNPHTVVVRGTVSA